MSDRIYARQFHAEGGAEAWRVFPEGAAAFFRSDAFSASVEFVGAIGKLAREVPAPSIDIRWDGVTVLIHAYKDREYGLVPRDLELARTISATAREMGLAADPSVVQNVSVIPGATDLSGVLPFWEAVLGYVPRPDKPDEDLVDPHARLAPFWFEQMDELRADGQGTIHLVVWVPWDVAEARVAAGLAAGGRLVRRNDEENFWTLADAVGNEIDVATTSAPDPVA